MRTLLVVEPQENQRILYRMELEDEGYRVLTADDVPGALRTVMRENLDLVVIDPYARGGQTTSVIRKLKAMMPNLPVVVYTGSASASLTCGGWLADACLLKNSNLEPLKQAVARLLVRSVEPVEPSYAGVAAIAF